jgi:hypothetical protein
MALSINGSRERGRTQQQDALSFYVLVIQAGI